MDSQDPDALMWGLTSVDWFTRKYSFEFLYIQISHDGDDLSNNWLYRKFYWHTGNHQITQNLCQDFAYKMFVRLRNGPIQDRNIRGYLEKVAESVRQDRHRNYKDDLYLFPTFSTEDSSFEILADMPQPDAMLAAIAAKDSPKTILKLLHHMVPRNELLWYALMIAGYTPQQIACLVPESTSTIYRRRDNLKEPLLAKLSAIDAGYCTIDDPSWEFEIWGTDRGSLGITASNYMPAPLSEESTQMLIRHFEVRSLEHLQAVYLPMLIILNAFTDQAKPLVALAKRSDHPPAILLPDNAYAVCDWTPVFKTELVYQPKTKKKERRVVVDLIERRYYWARSIGLCDDMPACADYMLGFPEMSVIMRKDHNPDEVAFFNKPYSKRKSVREFQAIL